MKEVVLAETATHKTIERKFGKFNFFSGGTGVLLGTLIPGVPAITVGATSFGMTAIAFGSLAWVISGFFTENLTEDIKKFNGEVCTKKSLKESIPSGTRKKIGKSKYSSKFDLKSSYLLTDSPKYKEYEHQLYVRNIKGKLTIEYEISELPLFAWENAYNALLANNNIEQSTSSYSTCLEIKLADAAAQEAKEEYIKNSPGFSFSK